MTQTNAGCLLAAIIQNVCHACGSSRLRLRSLSAKLCVDHSSYKQTCFHVCEQQPVSVKQWEEIPQLEASVSTPVRDVESQIPFSFCFILSSSMWCVLVIICLQIGPFNSKTYLDFVWIFAFLEVWISFYFLINRRKVTKIIFYFLFAKECKNIQL